MKSTWLVEEKTMTYLAVPRDDATWYENVKSSWHVSTEVKVSQGTRGVDGHREGGTASSHHEARGIVFATSGHDAFYVSLAFWTSQRKSQGFTMIFMEMHPVQHLQHPLSNPVQLRKIDICPVLREVSHALAKYTLDVPDVHPPSAEHCKPYRSSGRGCHATWCSFKQWKDLQELEKRVFL